MIEPRDTRTGLHTEILMIYKRRPEVRHIMNPPVLRVCGVR